MPEDFKWYYFNGKSPFDDCTKNRPLSFLTQINCEEVKKYDLDNRLPDAEILYFFYELETMSWGSYPSDKGSARVYYYNGDISKLVRTDYPEDMPRKYKLQSIKLAFESKENIPDYEEICNELNMDEWGKYNDFKCKDNIVSDDLTKLLGYADSIQGSMIYQCEAVSRKIYFYIREEELKNKNFENMWLILQCG